MYFVKSTCKLFRQINQTSQKICHHINCSMMSNYTCHDLSQSRSLVKVTGKDSAQYLQNLITNDIHLLDEDSQKSLYAMILNNRGRVLHDVLIYKLNNSNTNDKEYIIEMDKAYLTDFQRMLKIYSLKKKVKVMTADDSLKLYSLTNNNSDTPYDLITKENLSENIKICVSDPRFSKIGYRVLTEHNDSCLSDFFKNPITTATNLSQYKEKLYKHGIAENHEDITYGSSIPLEYNIVLLNGVSFSKGCYLGQELIAKTHHTGVIRKRILPMVLNNKESEISVFEQNCNILNLKTGKSAGKLKNLSGSYGIAMLRLSELDKDNLVLVDTEQKEHSISFNIPDYWKNDKKLAEQIKEFI